MSTEKDPPRALGLDGGGLDSRLAFEALRRRGVAVEGVQIDTGFVRPTHQLGSDAGSKRIDVRQRYLEQVVAAPRHGYGAAMNPCHDCRIFMLREADRLAREREISLLFTGDVIGQRAHDQSHRCFATVDAEAGVAGRVLRPLSASHLDPLEHPAAAFLEGPETRLQGRARREQLALAARWGVERFPTPSGRCCRLADPVYARRVRDYLEHRKPDELDADEIPLLAVGRQFRLAWDLKLVLSRNVAEGEQMRAAGARYGRCELLDGQGPIGRIDGAAVGTRAGQIAAVIARYSRRAAGGEVTVRIEHRGEQQTVRAAPIDPETLELWAI